MIALYQPVINFVRKRLIMTSIEDLKHNLGRTHHWLAKKKKLDQTIEKDFKTKKNNKHREKNKKENQDKWGSKYGTTVP